MYYKPGQQEGRVVMVRTGIVHVVENALPLAEIAQHFRCGFARPTVQYLVRFFAAAGRIVTVRR